MKTVFYTAIFFVATNSFAQNQTTTNSKPIDPLQPIIERKFREVDVPAEFPGGKKKLMEFLATNLKYPDRAILEKTTGKAVVEFIVKKDGTISDLKIRQPFTDCKACDEEALRVVKAMPKWKPAKANGEAVNSYFVLPIEFKVD